ncbi:MAG: hypothetical protein AAFX06_25055 [Planctomycetota bacterium]
MKCHTYVEDGVEYIEGDGRRHALGLNPDKERLNLKSLVQTMELPSYEQLRKRVDSEDFSFGRKHFDRSWTKDQNGWGKCASSAATYLVEKGRHLRGQRRLELADDYLYSLVNDGRDRGSTLAENMRAITQRGIATRATVDHGDIYRRKYDVRRADKEALRFRAHEAFFVNSEQEVVTALVNGICVGIAIHVGRNWQRFDKDGVLIGDRGVGNHAEHLDDVRYNLEKGRWEFRKHSSHGTSYGDGGFCWITWAHLRVHESHQKYAVPAVIDDPSGDNPFESEFDEEPLAEPVLTVTSSSGCHWCVKWDQNDRSRVMSAGVQIQKGEVPGRGVPRFRLEVGGQTIEKIGYWPADQILRQVANLQTAELVA